MELTGKLVIKACLGEDFRRIPIHNEDITYDELVLMMQRVFQGKIKSSDHILIKYKDEDGDLVTINDNADLLYSISCNRILRLKLYVNEKTMNIDPCDTRQLKKELQLIRNQINHVLDAITITDPSPLETLETGSKMIVKNEVKPKVSNVVNGKEFDPLRDESRLTDTPNSQASVGSDSLVKKSSRQNIEEQHDPSRSTTPSIAPPPNTNTMNTQPFNNQSAYSAPNPISQSQPSTQNHFNQSQLPIQNAVGQSQQTSTYNQYGYCEYGAYNQAQTGSGQAYSSVHNAQQMGVQSVQQAGQQNAQQMGVQGVQQAGLQNTQQMGVQGVQQAGFQSVQQTGLQGVQQMGVHNVQEHSLQQNAGVHNASAQGVQPNMQMSSVQNVHDRYGQGNIGAAEMGVNQYGVNQSRYLHN